MLDEAHCIRDCACTPSQSTLLLVLLCCCCCTLPQVRWRRIVLDEAHCIKDRACNTAKAVFALTSKYKWALSGTPLQVNESLWQQRECTYYSCMCVCVCVGGGREGATGGGGR